MKFFKKISFICLFIITLLCPVLANAQTNIYNNLIEWYRLDEQGGANIQDSGPNGYTQVLGNGSLISESGIIANCLDFNGTTLFETGPISIGTTYTAMAWIQPTNQANAANFGGIIDGGGDNVSLLYVDGSPASSFGFSEGSGGVGFATNFISGTWYHIASVRVGQTITLYLNGVAVTTNTISSNPSTTLQYLGARSDGFWYYFGLLDDVRIYNYALSAGEISNQYAWRDKGLTYYLSTNGSINNTGLSESSPWDRNPYFIGADGNETNYFHSAGDRFIFKGSQYWGSNYFATGGITFPLGGNYTNYDYFGVDTNWYDGSQFTRPKLDAQYNAHSFFTPASCTEFDSLEICHLSLITSGSLLSGGIIYCGNVNYILITNCWIHGWNTTNVQTSTNQIDSDVGGIIFITGGGHGCTNLILINDNIENSENNTNSGACGVLVFQANKILNCLIHDNSSGILFGQDVSNCFVYNIMGEQTGFDYVYHPNTFYMDHSNGSANNGFTNIYCRDNLFSNCFTTGMAYANPDQSECIVYGNIFEAYNGDGAIQCDSYNFGNGGIIQGVQIYNNTFIQTNSSSIPNILVNRNGESPPPGEMSHVIEMNNYWLGGTSGFDNYDPTITNTLVHTQTYNYFTATPPYPVNLPSYSLAAGNGAIQSGTNLISLGIYTTDKGENPYSSTSPRWDAGAWIYLLLNPSTNVTTWFIR